MSKSGRKAAINIRTTTKLREHIESAAKKNERSISEEVERRLELTVELDEKTPKKATVTQIKFRSNAALKRKLEASAKENELSLSGETQRRLEASFNPTPLLTKREQFAMAAMQGLLSADARYGGRTDSRALLAEDARAFADALISELDKKERDSE